MSGMCGGGQPFPTLDKGCTDSTNCSDGFHQIDCCGTLVAVGFNHAQRDTFNTAEQTWELTCPACGCAAQPTKAEDGKTLRDERRHRHLRHGHVHDALPVTRI